MGCGRDSSLQPCSQSQLPQLDARDSLALLEVLQSFPNRVTSLSGMIKTLICLSHPSPTCPQLCCSPTASLFHGFISSGSSPLLAEVFLHSFPRRTAQIPAWPAQHLYQSSILIASHSTKCCCAAAPSKTSTSFMTKPPLHSQLEFMFLGGQDGILWDSSCSCELINDMVAVLQVNRGDFLWLYVLTRVQNVGVEFIPPGFFSLCVCRL